MASGSLPAPLPAPDPPPGPTTCRATRLPGVTQGPAWEKTSGMGPEPRGAEPWGQRCPGRPNTAGNEALILHILGGKKLFGVCGASPGRGVRALSKSHGQEGDCGVCGADPRTVLLLLESFPTEIPEVRGPWEPRGCDSTPCPVPEGDTVTRGGSGVQLAAPEGFEQLLPSPHGAAEMSLAVLCPKPQAWFNRAGAGGGSPEHPPGGQRGPGVFTQCLQGQQCRVALPIPIPVGKIPSSHCRWSPGTSP